MSHRMTSMFIGAVAAIGIASPSIAQQNQGQTLGSTTGLVQAPPSGPAAPAPRLPDGRMNLGPLPGQKGVWAPSGIVQLALNPKSVNRANPNGQLPNNIRIEDVPFQPWARALHAYRQTNSEKDEPHTRCKPSGGARQFITPYGFEFVDVPELKRIYIIDIGGPHTYRTIFMDASHPKVLQPTYYGHSIGRWEGDTLVVDSVGFNEQFWIDREGSPHTVRLHLTERFTRTDFNTLKYEVTVDDPGAYTASWTGGFLLRWNAGMEAFEYVCQENNLSPEAMVGAETTVDRSSMITP